MSLLPLSRSPDLKRLRDEGYDVEVRANYLVINCVPYVNAKKEVKLGRLVSELTLAGDITARPSNHVALFAGEHPCHKDGSVIAQIKHASAQKVLSPDLVVDHSFSNKPQAGYVDYYEKMTTYIAIISSPAHALDEKVTAQTFPVIEPEADESPFNYLDTASSRARIGVVTNKLALEKVVIIGLGGTGAYVLDLVAKTPVKEIHLFDGDKFSQHNAFRCPGAPSIDELRAMPQKVAFLRDRYSKMHRRIVAHDRYLDGTTVEQLRGSDFVFLCLDKGEVKKLLIDKLQEYGIPFVDVGMGVQLVDDSLLGVLRVTTSTPQKRDHVQQKNRIPLGDGGENNEYSTNIQIADLNALNAALAVIKWKKCFGFYKDLENEHFTTYSIDGNTLINEDHG